MANWSTSPSGKTNQDTTKCSTLAPNKTSTMTVSSLQCKVQASEDQPYRHQPARGCKVSQQDAAMNQKKTLRESEELESKYGTKHSQILEKRRIVKTTTGGRSASFVLICENKTTSGAAGTADVRKGLSQRKCRASVIVQWKQKQRQLHSPVSKSSSMLQCAIRCQLKCPVLLYIHCKLLHCRRICNQVWKDNIQEPLWAEIAHSWTKWLSNWSSVGFPPDETTCDYCCYSDMREIF